MNQSKIRLQFWAAIVWLVLTCALIVWWMYFAVGLVEKVSSANNHHRFMLLSEGVTLLFFLIVGGLTLISFILKEQKRNFLLTQFFSAFTHDIKTSLASLRLQVESLRDDLGSQAQLQPTLQRLLGDTSRLQIQVENSLYLGHQKKPNLYIENVQLNDAVNALKDSWPQIEIICNQNAVLKVDRRALDSILNNIVHNSIVHGRASTVTFGLKQKNLTEVAICIQDNGKGFKGDLKKLGEIHFRQNPSSGSGLGLFIAISHAQSMQGQIAFQSNSSGFCIEIILPGALL